MVPSPVSHLSDVEWRELRSIYRDAVQQAASLGSAKHSFHGYRLIAIRRGFVDRCAVVDVGIRADGMSGSPTWDEVAVPSIATVNPP